MSLFRSSPVPNKPPRPLHSPSHCTGRYPRFEATHPQSPPHPPWQHRSVSSPVREYSPDPASQIPAPAPQKPDYIADDPRAPPPPASLLCLVTPTAGQWTGLAANNHATQVHFVSTLQQTGSTQPTHHPCLQYRFVPDFRAWRWYPFVSPIGCC